MCIIPRSINLATRPVDLTNTFRREAVRKGGPRDNGYVAGRSMALGESLNLFQSTSLIG